MVALFALASVTAVMLAWRLAQRISGANPVTPPPVVTLSFVVDSMHRALCEFFPIRMTSKSAHFPLEFLRQLQVPGELLQLAIRYQKPSDVLAELIELCFVMHTHLLRLFPDIAGDATANVMVVLLQDLNLLPPNGNHDVLKAKVAKALQVSNRKRLVKLLRKRFRIIF